jgi:hypothetical protein
VRLGKAVLSVEEELRKNEQKPSVVSGGLKVVKEIAVKVLENAAGKRRCAVICSGCWLSEYRGERGRKPNARNGGD